MKTKVWMNKQLVDPEELKLIRELMLMWRSYNNGKESKSKL